MESQKSIFSQPINDQYFYCVSLSLGLSAPSDLWEGTGQEVASALRALGLPIGPVVTMERRNGDGAREALRAVREADNVKGQRSFECKKWNVRMESSSLQVKTAIKYGFSHQYELIDYKLLIIMWISLAAVRLNLIHVKTERAPLCIVKKTPSSTASSSSSKTGLQFWFGFCGVWVFYSVSQCFTSVTQCYTVFYSILQCDSVLKCFTVWHSVFRVIQRSPVSQCSTMFINHLHCFTVCHVVVFRCPAVLLSLACTVPVEFCCLIFWFREYCLNNVWLCVYIAVIIMCMSSILIGGEDQRELLLAALDMGMVSDGYVFIPYDALLYAMPYQVTEQFISNHIDQ